MSRASRDAVLAALPFEDNHFDSAICLTMLHHVPAVDLQERLLAEMARVVKPDGAIMGSDSLDSPEFQTFLEGDICVPVPPEALAERLAGLGMTDANVDINPFAFKWADGMGWLPPAPTPPGLAGSPSGSFGPSGGCLRPWCAGPSARS